MKKNTVKIPTNIVKLFPNGQINSLIFRGISQYEYIKQIRKYNKELTNKKLTAEQSLQLFEEYFLKSAVLFKSLFQLPQKDNEFLAEKMYEMFYIFMSQVINRAKLTDKLSFMCFNIACLMTRYLMDSIYNNPSKELCSMLSVNFVLPFLISPWDSATEIKNTAERAFKTTGLAKAVNIKTKCRYSSVPTRIVLLQYKKAFLFSGLPPIAEADRSDEYWGYMKINLKNYFNNELSKEYPEYYRTLRDERGDKTPVYIRRKLWLQACKQALKGIAKASKDQTAP